jgi:preprotein translocase subunit Sec61beta
MANQGIHMPSSGGGLMRYNEEYNSLLKIKPTHVILFIIAVIAFTVILKIFFPITA